MVNDPDANDAPEPSVPDASSESPEAQAPPFTRPAGVEDPAAPSSAGGLESAGLIDQLHRREAEFTKLAAITERINRGLDLEEILAFVYEEMQGVIPYNRIGFSLIESEGRVAVSRWARSDRPVALQVGYRGALGDSSLQEVLRSGRPRVLNDLVAYLREHPRSHSTSLIVKEGMRSSLTCPLINQGTPVGFLFFSSVEPGRYRDLHVAFFEQLAGQLATIVEKGRLYSELSEQKKLVDRQNALLTRDLETARRVQNALIPRAGVGLRGVEVAFRYEPAAQVGGDVLDLVPLDESRLLALIGDAVGHGVSAALVMSVAKTALHSAMRSGHDPAAILAFINGMLAGLFDDQFVTAICCLLDRRRQAAELSLAGMRGPLWHRAASGQVEQLESDGLPLGLDTEAAYQTHRLQLEHGDTLLFYTDGVVESQDAGQRLFGRTRLESLLIEAGNADMEPVLDRICEAVRAHCSPRQLDDDCTLLAMRIAPA
jgi:serine phosphatase RsbU (regulator of sigma subunit)